MKKYEKPFDVKLTKKYEKPSGVKLTENRHSRPEGCKRCACATGSSSKGK